MDSITEEDDTRQSPYSNIIDDTTTSLGHVQEQLFDSPISTDLMVHSCSRALDASLRRIPKSLPSIPVGTIPEADCSTINVYFRRHPVELVISSEFVDEMNAVVLMVLQDSPSAIGDALYGIGRVYMDQDSQSTKLPLALNRRARTLARLRVKDPNRELEQMLVMMLALSGMELIDTKCRPHERTFPIIVGYAASIINKYLGSGLVLSSLAKYFIRTLARQDMMISLSQLRRNAIRTDTWLDDTAKHNADRFMGYTATLMPLLEELCALSEDVHQSLGITRGKGYELGDATSIPLSLTTISMISQRAMNLQFRLRSWRPIFSQEISARTSRRLLAQAYATRAAASLMLHRLVNPAGSSEESDREAFEMACEIMAHLNGQPEDLRLSTFPALIASCELESEEDRAVAVEIFEGIYNARKTGTSLQTKDFVVDRVWKARDAGEDWDWMVLSQKYPGECVPI
ncbi:fungal-specific transcription factor domain-containing protein [Exophiala viscosa]|uniref:Fungal-specific transcription factor domain-containing protein n=1 Tax=Exophiala viscosa TaxID=2486360 RepID=A0AAN6ICL9_9EURO|nr:fungal-specific transcription factor domain-containing protein [Exophiala viscosa]